MSKSNAKLKKLKLGTIHPRGWMAEQLRRNIEGMGGHLDELEPRMIATPYTTRETHEPWGEDCKAGWGAEISGNFWWGEIELAFTTGNEKLIAKVTKWVDEVLANARPDGYLGTYTEKDNMFDDYNGWGNALGMLALLAFYDATGREDVFEAVYRCMLWFCENWAGDRKTRYASTTLIEPMMICYEKTQDKRLLDFCHDFYDFLERNDLFDLSLSKLLSDELHYASNHASAIVQDLDHPALIYAQTGDKMYLRASTNTYDKLQNKGMQATGAVVCESEYLAPPGGVADSEYCSFTYYNKSLINLLTVTADTRYGDEMERGVFNAAEGARKKDEKAIAYMSAPNQLSAHIHSSRTGTLHQVYAPCVPTACCPVNSVRILPEFVASMAMEDNDGTLYFTTYAPAELSYRGMQITLDTLYPFRDTLIFTFSGGNETIPVKFRAPAWCDAPVMQINGIPCAFAVKDGWITPDVPMKDGDTVVLRLPMHVEVIRIDDTDRRAKYPLCIKYGPLVYSLQVPENWRAYAGRPATPLPEGWHWYEGGFIEPKSDLDVYDHNGIRKHLISWNVALDECIPADDLTVEEIDADGYPWEVPYIKLHLPAYKAPYSYPSYSCAFGEPYTEGGYSVTTHKLEIELIPYGMTALRITYFPRAKHRES